MKCNRALFKKVAIALTLTFIYWFAAQLLLLPGMTLGGAALGGVILCVITAHSFYEIFK